MPRRAVDSTFAPSNASFQASWRLVFVCPIALQLADVVHEAIKQPLGVDLGLAAQAEAPQAVSVSDVGEHRLDDSETPTLNHAVRGLHLGALVVGEVALLHPS